MYGGTDWPNGDKKEENKTRIHKDGVAICICGDRHPWSFTTFVNAYTKIPAAFMGPDQATFGQ